MAGVSSVGLGLVYFVGWLTSKFQLRRGPMCLLCLLLVDVLNFLTTVDSLLLGCVSWTVREGMLNGMLELKKSIMMDYTPKGSRKNAVATHTCGVLIPWHRRTGAWPNGLSLLLHCIQA